ncbi:hypothetical protein Dxin01_00140 [Deinococcus xinjiangensis]|uniref:Uncharacterized protein n=1 Tax=Deinococcus xinjiangensis TaxID=457454 RepID=A0ABP9V561_9DEIO
MSQTKHDPEATRGLRIYTDIFKADGSPLTDAEWKKLYQEYEERFVAHVEAQGFKVEREDSPMTYSDYQDAEWDSEDDQGEAQ